MLSAISHFSPHISAYSAAHPQTRAIESAPSNAVAPETVKQQNADKNNLTAEELAEVQKLKQRDTEVKSHEQAHLSAAGGIASSGASFSFQRGPNGQRYAVGGEVQIDTSAVADDPAATIRKAEMIKRAALAPTSPSSQDQKVAAQATSMAAKARAELLQLERENANPENSGDLAGALFNQVA
jgi:hypothetical protein